MRKNTSKIRAYFRALPAILLVALASCGDPVPVSKVTLPVLEADRIVGIGIAPTNGHAFAWTAAGTVSEGTSYNLVWHQSPFRFEPAAGRTAGSIVATAMIQNKVYTWYSDKTRSVGTLTDLDYYSPPISYVIPGGRSPSDIVGIAIAKSTNHVYAWYRDGMMSAGTSWNLGAYISPRPYYIPWNQTRDDIVGVAITNQDHVRVWYADGKTTEGSSTHLYQYEYLKYYTRHGYLRSAWPSRKPTPSVAPSLAQMLPVHRLDTNISSGNADSVIAPGRYFVAVATDAAIQFYYRNGQPLNAPLFHNGGNTLPLDDMFENFVRTPGVSQPLDVNNYLGFSQPCESYPATDGDHFCIAGGPYDTRVSYDVAADRFVIVGRMRNRVWTNAFSATAGQPFDTEEGNLTCGIYTIVPDDTRVDATSGQCNQARRVYAIAVSRTNDPRDGFHTYVATTSNYRDWPWIALKPNWLILSNQGAEDLNGSAATLVNLSDLRDGATRPEYIEYTPADIGNLVVAEPPEQQRGSATNVSLLVGYAPGGGLRLVGLGHPTNRYGKIPAVWIDYPSVTDFARERVVYHGNTLHLAGQPFRTTMGWEHRVIRYQSIGLTFNAYSPTLDFNGYRRDIEIAPIEADGYHSNEEPAIQVNGSGDVVIAWGHWGYVAPPPWLHGEPDVRYMLWRDGEVAPESMQIFRAGDAIVEDQHGNAVKALNAGVDPFGSFFWVIHKYGRAFNDWGTVLGTVIP